MLKQREYERQYGLEDSLSDPEEEETSARLSTQQKQQSRRTKSISPAQESIRSLDIDDFEDSRPIFHDDEDNNSETSDGGAQTCRVLF